MLVFVIHNKADKHIARELAMFLAAEEVSIWFDEWEIADGESITGKMGEGPAGCTHFLLLWSKHANTSHWVRRELESVLVKAIEQGSPKVIPVMLDSTPPPAMIRDLLYIRYTNGSEEDRQNLVEAVLGSSPSTNFLRAVVNKYRELVLDAGRTDTLGFVACPRCGSEGLAPDTDVEVDTNYSNGEVTHSPIFFHTVRCTECGWSRREDEGKGI